MHISKNVFYLVILIVAIGKERRRQQKQDRSWNELQVEYGVNMWELFDIIVHTITNTAWRGIHCNYFMMTSTSIVNIPGTRIRAFHCAYIYFTSISFAYVDHTTKCRCAFLWLVACQNHGFMPTSTNQFLARKAKSCFKIHTVFLEAFPNVFFLWILNQ